MSAARLRFYVDENIASDVAKILGSVYRMHSFRTPYQEKLTGGVKDIELFHDLARRNFHAIITMDSRQLDDREERAALAACGLHWIGFPMPQAKGSTVIAKQAATVLAGFPYVLEHWVDVPSAYHLPGLAEARPNVEQL